MVPQWPDRSSKKSCSFLETQFLLNQPNWKESSIAPCLQINLLSMAKGPCIITGPWQYDLTGGWRNDMREYFKYQLYPHIHPRPENCTIDWWEICTVYTYSNGHIWYLDVLHHLMTTPAYQSPARLSSRSSTCRETKKSNTATWPDGVSTGPIKRGPFPGSMWPLVRRILLMACPPFNIAPVKNRIK